MEVMIFLSGVIVGVILNIVINDISERILDGINTEKKTKKELTLTKSKKPIKTFLQKIVLSNSNRINIFLLFITGGMFLVSYIHFGFRTVLLKAIILNCILIIVSFVDLKHNIIPNYIVIITLIAGILFIFIGDISLISALLGMLSGGGLLFLLAMIPNALGGGDIKLMFALGAFLGVGNTIRAIFLAFILAAIISMFLILFKIKGRKDYIPFGPFLALGSFIAFYFLK